MAVNQLHLKTTNEIVETSANCKSIHASILSGALNLRKFKQAQTKA
jgi:hypothetical protein